ERLASSLCKLVSKMLGCIPVAICSVRGSLTRSTRTSLTGSSSVLHWRSIQLLAPTATSNWIQYGASIGSRRIGLEMDCDKAARHGARPKESRSGRIDMHETFFSSADFVHAWSRTFGQKYAVLAIPVVGSGPPRIMYLVQRLARYWSRYV